MLDLGSTLTCMRNVLPHPSSMGIALLGGFESSSMKQEDRQQRSSCPGVSQVQQSGVEKHYLCCQARDELCPTTGLYLMEMSRNSSRFKSRHQEMDNASYLDMPQTTAGMHPLARQEQAAKSRLRTQPSAEATPQPRDTQTLPWERACMDLLLHELKPAVTTGYYATSRMKVNA